MAHKTFDVLSEEDIRAIGHWLRAPGADGDPPWLLLAVSGGVDSMALMHIVAGARVGGCGADAGLLVATVDHGLRPGSADEAAFVAEEARQLGFSHVTLPWRGPKPATGIQEAARAARYALLGEVIHAQPARSAALVTAHTLDDQAETVLMRLARGSGVEGLSGMREREQLRVGGAGARPITVLRPLLNVRKERLIASMRAWGRGWREDPGNTNAAFERVRVRKSMAALAELGLTAEVLGRSARRLGRVRDGLRAEAARVLANHTLARFSPLGFVELDADLWRGVRTSAAVAQRVLGIAIRAAGGMERPVSLRALEALSDSLGGAIEAGRRAEGVTLGRAKIMHMDVCVRVQRETGRDLAGPMQLEPGERAVWDNRFEVQVAAGYGRGLVVRALGASGVAMLRAADDLPAERGLSEVLEAVPGFWDGARLVAVPSLGGAGVVDVATARFPAGGLFEA